MASEIQTKIVTIDLDTRAYDIYIGQNLLTRIHDFIPQDITDRAIFIITDTNVEPYAQQVQTAILQSGAKTCEIKTLPFGEKTKSFARVEGVNTWMLKNNINRDSLILAIGGGVIGDLAGFCAAITMRGVPYIQIPTTLLSQVDSAVGGKTGINTEQGKNLIGSFYQPTAVIADIETLKTLPQRELLAGYAEVVKYGLIDDINFFNWLELNGEKVTALDPAALACIIEHSCKAKANVVQADEREQGRRALLNLGHTFGHALELESGYGGDLLHGEAVSIGTIMAFDTSYRLGLCKAEDLERVENHFTAIGLPTRATTIESLETNVDAIIKAMQHDKKAQSGKITFVMVKGIGEAFLTNDIPESTLREVIRDSLGGESKKAEKQKPKGIKERWSSAFSSPS